METSESPCLIPFDRENSRIGLSFVKIDIVVEIRQLLIQFIDFL